MERRTKNVAFVGLTIVLIIFGVLSVTGTVMSKVEPDGAELEYYYLEKEKELVQETRAYLNKSGYRNSGVTLTRVVDECGNREYTMTVHHSKINALDKNARESLRKELNALTFASANCVFYHEFLATE